MFDNCHPTATQRTGFMLHNVTTVDGATPGHVYFVTAKALGDWLEEKKAPPRTLEKCRTDIEAIMWSFGNGTDFRQDIRRKSSRGRNRMTSRPLEYKTRSVTLKSA